MLTIVTVNFNGSEDTLALLRSLEQQTDRNFDVIVVDNDSLTEDRIRLAEYAATSPLGLDMILSDRNRGFSGGCNMGIRKALAQGGEWVFLLNNDTTVPDDFISALRPALTEPAVIGIPLQEGDQTAYAGKVQWLCATFRHLHQPVEMVPQNHYVIGGALIAHRDVFTRVGLLDERYFLYFEDADFTIRARAAGYPIRFLRAPVARHAVSASTSRLGAPLLLRYHMRNALLFNAIHAPGSVRAVLPFWAIFSMVKQLIKLLMLPARQAQSRAIAAGIIDFYASHFGYIPSATNRRY